MTSVDPLPRPRIADRLDRALDARTRLTLVSAPPGYGKSVAVRSWVDGAGLPVAWVTFEPGDGDPAAFAGALLAALEPARPGATALARAIAGAGPSHAAIGQVVIRAIEANDADLLVVLDDAHHVASSGAAAVIAHLVAKAPPFLHLVLVSRQDPSLPLARLRALGALVEVRADDLRFTPGEVADFLTNAGHPAEPALAEALATRSEGWAAALQLAVAALGERDAGTAANLPARAERFVFDFLADEVMAGLGSPLDSFLAAVSVVERFDIGLAEELSGRPDAGALLDRAERANLFVNRAEPAGPWFRLHGLFAGYLQSRLGRAERGELDRRAGAWLERNGDPRSAIRHFLAAGAHRDAARLVAVEGRRAFEAGELDLLGSWIAALPAPAIAASADLVALEAWHAFQTGRLADARDLAAAHLGTVPARGAAEGRLLVLLALLGAIMDPAAERQALEGIALLPDDHLFRSMGFQAAGLSQISRGDNAAALGTLRAAFREAGLTGHPAALLPAANTLGHALEAAGRRDEAEAVAREVLDEFQGPADRPLSIAWSAMLVLGIARFEAGDVTGARRELERGAAAAAELGIGRDAMGWALPSLALARQAAGDAAGALEALRVRGRGVARSRLELPSMAAETEARIRLAQGDLAAASRWADDPRPEAPAGSPLLALLGLTAGLTVARVRLAEGRPHEALALATPARAALEAVRSVPDWISALLLEATALRETGDREAAIGALRAAVALAAPGGYVRRFVDDGGRLAPLLAAVRDVAPAFVDRVSAALPGASDAPSPARGTTIRTATDGSLIESLTPRELDVLRALATGATNAAIADRLGISPGTAKWHIAHVLGKLGARSRTAAVVRGRDLGLI